MCDRYRLVASYIFDELTEKFYWNTQPTFIESCNIYKFLSNQMQLRIELRTIFGLNYK